MRKVNQNKRVLEYIKEHGTITSFDAFKDLGITRLSGRIYDLREEGYEIEMTYAKGKDGARYGVYRLAE